MLDLNKVDLAKAAEAGYTFELKHPISDEGTGAFVTVRGDKSKIVQAFGRKRVNEMQKKSNKNRGKQDDLKVEDMEEMLVEGAVVRIISWKGLTEDGKEYPFSTENATAMLTKHDWIRAAVMEAAENLENFPTE